MSGGEWTPAENRQCPAEYPNPPSEDLLTIGGRANRAPQECETATSGGDVGWKWGEGGISN